MPRSSRRSACARGAAPARVHVSPRVGFSYTYNRDRENGNGHEPEPVGRFYRYPTGTLRGGIGEFRDLLRPGILADASAATGLPGGTLTLSCVGAAVPAARLVELRRRRESRSQCLDGSGVLAERAPSVTLIDPGYDVPRSWRSSLDWTTERATSWLDHASADSRRTTSPSPARSTRTSPACQQLTLAGGRQSSGVRVGGVDRSGDRRRVGGGVATVGGVRTRGARA